MRLRLVTSLLLLGLSCLNMAYAAVVENVRTYRSPEYTRLVFDLNEGIDHRVFTLDDPNRVVVDLIDSEMKENFDNLDLSDTPIASLHSSSRNEHDVRVVLEMRGKVQPRSFVLGKNEQYGDRLVIDLYDNNDADDAPHPVASASVSDLVSNKRDIVVAISAGHGGEDPGAIGIKRLQEKKVTLAIAREVEKRINDTPGYRAVMIRDGDYFVGLRNRIETAHESNADLYIAIHADAADHSSATGSTIYALSQRGATSEQARRLAEKENSTDLIGGVGSISLTDKDEILASVLLDLSMTASVASSLEIGDSLIASIGRVTKMRRTNVEQAAFVELKSADIPSLLIESGYITNPSDAKNLDSPEWRERFAGSVVNGITSWFYERPPRGTLVAWQKDNGSEVQLAPSTYVVKRGDTLSELANRFGVSMADIKQANKMKSSTVQLGQTLKIPGGDVAVTAQAEQEAEIVFIEHTIARGETLSGIATNYAVSMDRIRASNQLKSDSIQVGQVLKIPTT
ncbi:MAG: N-acetylmuramoyl-L-alanine amidase [Pseudomonadota bacterium]